MQADGLGCTGVTENTDSADPMEHVRQAKVCRDQGDINGAKLASLKAVRRAQERNLTLPNDWAAAFNNSQQAEVEHRRGNDQQSNYYLQLALDEALAGLDKFEG